VVVSGGRALDERFNEVLAPLADTLGAALGASRRRTDARYCLVTLQSSIQLPSITLPSNVTLEPSGIFGSAASEHFIEPVFLASSAM
jgi:hypothetical protein